MKSADMNPSDDLPLYDAVCELENARKDHNRCLNNDRIPDSQYQAAYQRYEAAKAALKALKKSRKLARSK